MKTMMIYVLAAVCEIAGCFGFWAWLRLGRSAGWAIGGLVLLIAFAWLLTFSEARFAGRAFAAYGGIYIISSLAWLALVEKTIPDRWDFTGAVLCLTGAAVILMAPRGALS